MAVINEYLNETEEHEPELVWDDKIPEPPAEPEPEAETSVGSEPEAEPEIAGPAETAEAPEADMAAEPEKPEEKPAKKGLWKKRKKDKGSDADKAAAEGEPKKKRSKFRIIFKLVLALILILLVLFATFMYIIPAFNRADGTKVSGSADWMAQLPDRNKISVVTIPGTHDSATKNVGLAYFSKCQSFTIERQLESGYRYLDIRLAVDGGQLKLMHGFNECRVGGAPWSETMYLEDVLSQCYSFLDEHPTEFIIFAVKQEHGRESVNEFERLLASFVMQEPERWLLTDKIPTVGEARGKLILMRRYEDKAGLGASAGMPILWEEQGNRKDTDKNIAEENNGTYTLWVQDRYKYDVDTKWAAFVAGQESDKIDTVNMSIHFLSTNGDTLYGHPYKYAKELNEKFMSEDLDLSGWIIMDFASAPMAEKVYSENF